jgi:hypothetical protein
LAARRNRRRRTWSRFRVADARAASARFF